MTPPIIGLTTAPPIQYPTVTIDGRTLTLKFSLLAQYVLDGLGVDPRSIAPTLQNEGPGKVALAMKLFSAAVAENFATTGEPIPAPEHWAMRIPSEQWAEVCKATFSAMVKAPPAATAAQEPPATQGSPH